MIIIFLRLTYGLLSEKENKIREGMKIMGMKDGSFYLSWVIYYLIISLITGILTMIVLKITVFAESNFLILLLCH